MNDQVIFSIFQEVASTVKLSCEVAVLIVNIPHFIGIMGSIRITLTATLIANETMHTTGSVSNGYATYEESNTTTGTGLPVLIVTTIETNNNGYYTEDYYDPVAYWVKDNVFYQLRVTGSEAERAEIQDLLDRILKAI